MLNFEKIDPNWTPIVQHALKKVDAGYLKQINEQTNWLPGQARIFNAFSLPYANLQYILFGESPYPRQQSANGYAFWDDAVSDLWSDNGLSKPVNRATSLRNIMKMLLIAEGALTTEDCSQGAIAALDKSTYVSTIDELFTNFIDHGILLLNASLVLSEHSVAKDAKAWLPFMSDLLNRLRTDKPEITLILFGKIAEKINQLEDAKAFNQMVAEHPYNLSFVNNPSVIEFFKPLHLLRKKA